MAVNFEETFYVFDSLDTALAIVRDDNTILYANREFVKLNPFISDREKNYKIFEIYPETLTEKIIEAMVLLRQNPKQKSQSLFYTSLNGAQRSDIFSNITNKHQNRIGISIKSRDILETEEIFDKAASDKNVSFAKREQAVKEAEEKQGRDFYYLERIVEISKTSPSLAVLIEQFFDVMMEMLDAECSLLKLVDPAKKISYPPIYTYGLSEQFIKKISNAPMNDCVCAKALAQKQIVYTQDLTREKQNRCSACREEGFRFIMTIPLIYDNEVKGILQFASANPRVFSDAELLSLEIAGRTISSSFEATEAKEKLYTEISRNTTILKTLKEPIALVDMEGKIESAGNSLSSMLGIPNENLTSQSIGKIFLPQFQTEFSSIFSHKDGHYGKIDEKVYSSETKLITSEREIDVKVTFNPIADQSGLPCSAILQIEDLEANAKYIRELDRRTKEFAAVTEMISELNDEIDLKVYCKKALVEFAKLMPVASEQFLVYYLDDNTHLLNLIAHEGIPQEFIDENDIVSPNSPEFNKAISAKKVTSSNIAGTSIWKTVIPLTYRSQVRGAMVIFANKEFTRTHDDKFLALGGIILGTALEKQALYDSFSRYAKSINEFTDKIGIISTLTQESDINSEPNEKLLQISKVILSLSAQKKMSITTKSQDGLEYIRYKFDETNGFYVESNASVKPESRDEYVFKTGQSSHFSLMEKSNNVFADDGEDSEVSYVDVLPFFEQKELVAILRLEGDIQFSQDELANKFMPLLMNLFIASVKLVKTEDISDELTHITNRAQVALQDLASVREENAKLKLELSKSFEKNIDNMTENNIDIMVSSNYADDLLPEITDKINGILYCTDVFEIYSLLKDTANNWFDEISEAELEISSDFANFDQNIDLLLPAGETPKSSAMKFICNVAKTRGQEIMLLSDIYSRLEKWNN